MEDGVTVDVPSFAVLLLCLHLDFVASLNLGPVQIASARLFTTSGDKSSGGVVSLCTECAERWPRLVLIGCGTYGFICLHTLNCCLIDSFSFLLLYGFMQPRESAPKEGDNVTALLHVTCPGPGNTLNIYSWLTMSLRSLAIISPYLNLPYVSLP